MQLDGTLRRDDTITTAIIIGIAASGTSVVVFVVSSIRVKAVALRVCTQHALDIASKEERSTAANVAAPLREAVAEQRENRATVQRRSLHGGVGQRQHPRVETATPPHATQV